MKKIFFILCILFLSGCEYFTRYNTIPLDAGIYVPEEEGDREFTYHETPITLNDISLQLVEITKEEYYNADGKNVIEDTSQKIDKRQYYKITITFVIDNVEKDLELTRIKENRPVKNSYVMNYIADFGFEAMCFGRIWRSEEHTSELQS